MAIEVQLKRAYTTGKMVLGTKNAEKALLNGELKGICFSRDIEGQAKERFLHYLSLEKLPFKELNFGPKEIGEIIGVDYPVTALGIISEGKAKLIEELEKTGL